MSSASQGLDGLLISQPAELALKAMHENMKRFRVCHLSSCLY